MIEIKEVFSKEGRKAFVKFPFKLYKNSTNWVPPIISEELNVFDTTKNPILKDAEARLFWHTKTISLLGEWQLLSIGLKSMSKT